MASIKRIDIVNSNVLEAKLELLHNCFAYKTKPILPPLLAAKHTTHYDDFFTAMEKVTVTDGTDGEHIKALTDLRKALLGA